MNQFSFYLGVGHVSFALYVLAVTLVLYVGVWSKRGTALFGWSRKARFGITLALYAVLLLLTVNVGHRQQDLNRQKFDTPANTTEEPKRERVRIDAKAAFEEKLQKQREENKQ